MKNIPVDQIFNLKQRNRLMDSLPDFIFWKSLIFTTKRNLAGGINIKKLAAGILKDRTDFPAQNM